MLEGVERDAAAVGALEDGLRRSLYLFVRAAGRPVSRDEAAEATGISRKLAAFHLDKLVQRGLLVPTYARPAGRGGRGAGRSAKYYEPSERQIDVTIPERRYDLLGSVFLRALRSPERGASGDDLARRAARQTGEEIGAAERARRKLAPPGAERAMSVAAELLEHLGYEPYRDERGCVRMRSCPFDALARQERELVCGMNQQLIEGVVRGLGNRSLDVAFAPVPGECCVRIDAPNG